MVRQSFLWMARLVAVSALLSGGAACSDCSLSISTHSLPNGTVGVFDFGSGETAFKGFSLEVDEPAGEPTPTSTVEPTETPAS